MTYPYAGSFGIEGTGVDGVTVTAWDVSRFGSQPALNDPPPDGDPDATTTTGVDSGFDGAYTLELPSTDQFYVLAVYLGVNYWQGPVAGAGAGGGITELTSEDDSVNITNPNGPVTDLSVPIPDGVVPGCAFDMEHNTTTPVNLLTEGLLVFPTGISAPTGSMVSPPVLIAEGGAVLDALTLVTGHWAAGDLAYYWVVVITNLTGSEILVLGVGTGDSLLDIPASTESIVGFTAGGGSLGELASSGSDLVINPGTVDSAPDTVTTTAGGVFVVSAQLFTYTGGITP